MQLALRPYVTTGIAIVGASVIAVAPIVPTPTEIQIPNPAVQVNRAVELTANEIEAAVNQIVFAATSLGVRLATLPAPLLAPLLGVPPETASTLLALGALGLGGPLISGPGAIGTAVQGLVNQLGSFDIAGLINELLQAPQTIIGGFVNGGFGPNIDSLALDFGIPFFAGGLIGQLSLVNQTLPGTIPALQALVDTLLGTLGIGGASMTAAALAPDSEGAIEGAVNALVFNLVARPIVTVAGLVGTILEPLLGEEVASGLPIAALGLLGPLVSGPGALGTAVQNVFDSLGSGNPVGILNSLINAPATLIDGVVNGGYGPNLQSLLPDLPPALPLGEQLVPVTSVLAGGLIPNPGYLYIPLLKGLGLKVGAGGAGLLLPGVFPTLQQLVGQILGFLPGASALKAVAPVAPLSLKSVDTVDTSNKRLVTLDVAPDLGDDPVGKHAVTDNTPPPPTEDLKAGDPSDGKVPPKLDEIKAAIDTTPPGPDLGKNVSEAAKPDTKPTPPGATGTETDTLDMTDGGKVVPDTTAGDNGPKKGKGGSNPVGAAISSVAKSFAGAVKSALGG